MGEERIGTERGRKVGRMIRFPIDCPLDCPHMTAWDMSIDDWTYKCDKLKIQMLGGLYIGNIIKVSVLK